MTERNFRVKGVNHLGLAPKDPERFAKLLKDLGLRELSTEVVPTQATSTHIFGFPAFPDPVDNMTENLLEILSPTVPNEGPIASFLTKKGGGIHHLALTVDHLHSAVEHLQTLGYQFISDTPQNGVCGTLIVFLHPHSTGGVLVELVQNP
jgi:methylmalonyl-CoA/ethylmalonyl-CoA epimerase